MTDAPDVMLQAPDEEGWQKLDAFSDVLRVIRLSGGVFLEAEFTAPGASAGRSPRTTASRSWCRRVM
jgi:hypothetical protein